ncbi:MAG: type II toxin-antitoxin system VapC family toxin [Alphaproteobacteria bacterium]|nr:type II toxin-antitoxin system VapC family toxin [Alphaproteobacteria bacterium]
MIILDTNVLSELMRPAPAREVRDWLLGGDDDLLVTTAVTIFEIEFGLARLPAGRRRSDLEARFATFTGPQSPFSVLPFDDATARIGGRLRADNQSRGLPAGPVDMMIAAIAHAANAALATRNVKDFVGTGLTLIDPWTAASIP